MKIIHTSGKRKAATARAVLKEGTGLIRINGANLVNYNPELLRLKIQEPLILAEKVAQKVNVSIKTHGGGITGQCDAARLALARALVEYDKKLEKVFLNYDRHLLIADVRRTETSKPNDSKPRAKRQKSYR